MLNRRAFIIGGLALLAAALAAEAQPRAKVWKVGYLGIPRPQGGSRGLEAFLDRLRELGYAEGRNLVFEQRYTDGDVTRYPSLVAELLRLNVDLFFVLGTPAAEEVKRQAATIPIVMVGGRAPVESGLVKSLARPGGNVTGLIQDVGHDVSIKGLELLREVVPHTSRITILTSSQAENIQAISLLEAAARRIDTAVDALVVSNQRDIENAFTSMSRNGIRAMMALPSHPLLAHRQLVVELAARHRIPAMYWFGAFVELGGLMSYGIDWTDLYRRSADYVAKIFKGAKPSDLPIAQPTKFELFINLKTAGALGLTIPPSLLLRADRLIE